MKKIIAITALLICMPLNICLGDSWDVVSKTETEKVLIDNNSISTENGIVSLWVKKYTEKNAIIIEYLSFMSIDCAKKKYTIQEKDELIDQNIVQQGNAEIDMTIKPGSIEDKISKLVCTPE